MTTNHEVIATIRRHHEQLSHQFDDLAEALIGAVGSVTQATAARDELHAWLTGELLPHAAAEEGSLYEPGLHRDETRLLVKGMLAEHRALRQLVDRLAVAPPFEAANLAAAARAVFGVHLAKENDLLLPALDAAGLDLSAGLHGMHELLGHG